jgi:hypothetical protein
MKIEAIEDSNTRHLTSPSIVTKTMRAWFPKQRSQLALIPCGASETQVQHRPSPGWILKSNPVKQKTPNEHQLTPSVNSKTTSTSVNLLGLQNVQLHFTMTDVFGVGQFWSACVGLYMAHDRFMMRIEPKFLRLMIIVWERIMLTWMLWQVVRVVDIVEGTMALLFHLIQDGIYVLEMSGSAVHWIASGFWNFLAGS